MEYAYLNQRAFGTSTDGTRWDKRSKSWAAYIECFWFDSIYAHSF